MNRLLVADARLAAAAHRAAVDRDELAEDVPLADHAAASARPCTSGPAAPGRSRPSERSACRRRSRSILRSLPMRRCCSACQSSRRDRWCNAGRSSCPRRSRAAGMHVRGRIDIAPRRRQRPAAALLRRPADRPRRPSPAPSPAANGSARAVTSSAADRRARPAGGTSRCSRRAAHPRRRWCAGALEQQDRRHLRQRLDHQHRRHQRRAGKVAREELLVDRDVLDARRPARRARAPQWRR